MNELGEQDAAGLGIDPANQDTHRRHGGGEGEEEREPVHSVRRRAPQKIDHRDVPCGPQEPQHDSGSHRTLGPAQRGEREPGPTDLLEEAGSAPERETNPKAIGRENRRYERSQAEQNSNH
jgi:hypothetical protein